MGSMRVILQPDATGAGCCHIGWWITGGSSINEKDRGKTLHHLSFYKSLVGVVWAESPPITGEKEL